MISRVRGSHLQNTIHTPHLRSSSLTSPSLTSTLTSQKNTPLHPSFSQCKNLSQPPSQPSLFPLHLGFPLDRSKCYPTRASVWLRKGSWHSGESSHKCSFWSGPCFIVVGRSTFKYSASKCTPLYTYSSEVYPDPSSGFCWWMA